MPQNRPHSTSGSFRRTSATMTASAGDDDIVTLGAALRHHVAPRPDDLERPCSGTSTPDGTRRSAPPRSTGRRARCAGAAVPSAPARRVQKGARRQQHVDRRVRVGARAGAVVGVRAVPREKAREAEVEAAAHADARLRRRRRSCVSDDGERLGRVARLEDVGLARDAEHAAQVHLAVHARQGAVGPKRGGRVVERARLGVPLDDAARHENLALVRGDGHH